MPVSNEIQKQLLARYEGNLGLYEDYCRTLCGLIESMLLPRGIQTHSITFRAKSVDSLAEKLTRHDKSYCDLEDITDLAGVRITTYFADDVDRVADVLRVELQIDNGASVDKRLYADPDRFGYKSLHYVVSLGTNRATLAEYSRFRTLKCEIQVRSILQHAWAEIEHDLGYKSAAGVPAELRRKFARIASLLELADDEFTSIRSALSQYEQAVPEKIRTAPQSVALDLPSLKALYLIPSAVASLDTVVAEAGNFNITSKLRKGDELVQRLHSFGLKSVEALEQTARSERNTVEAFVRYWRNSDTITEVDAGIGIFYLLYVLVWRTRDRARVLAYLNEHAIGGSEDRGEIADRVLAFNLTA